MKRSALFICLLAIGAAVSACGGAGGGSNALPQQNSALNTSAAVKIVIPNAANGSSLRRPDFVSPNTASIAIGLFTVNGATPHPQPTPFSFQISNAADCTPSTGGTTCNVHVTVPSANAVVLEISSFDASGNLLGQGFIGPINTTQTPVAQQSVSLGGVISTILASPSALSAPDDGTTHTLTFTLSAQDADGDTLIPPAAYAAPIALAISGDPNGAVSLSPTSIASPGSGSNGATTVTLTYNSAKALTGTVTLTATSGTATGTVAFSGTAGLSGGGGAVGPPFTIEKYTTPNAGGKIFGIALGPDGQTLWFADQGTAAIGAIANPAGCTSTCVISNEIQPFFSPPPAGLETLTSAPDGNIYIADLGNVPTLGGAATDPGAIYQLTGCTSVPFASCNPSGPLGTSLATPAPTDIIAAPDGNLYATSFFSGGFSASTILFQAFAGCCSEFGANAAAGPPSSLTALAVDSAGSNVWFTDTGTANIGFFPLGPNDRFVTEEPSGTVNPNNPGIIRRPKKQPPPRRDITNGATNGAFTAPLNGIVAGPDGNIYVAEAGAHRIDQLSPTTWETCSGCTFTPIALPQTNAVPQNLIVGPDGNIWFTDTTGFVGFIALNTCATGCRAFEYNVGGTPWGIARGPDGDIWFTDSSTNTIGKVVLQ
jgi:streptogramin lyase